VGREFGVEQFAIGANFERAAAGWYQRERRDPIAEFKNLSRQTDGFRRVVSNHAIFDPDFGFHQVLLSQVRSYRQGEAGQGACSLGCSRIGGAFPGVRVEDALA
jgi:hypothetical protein